jgi:hypothetical protein
MLRSETMANDVMEGWRQACIAAGAPASLMPVVKLDLLENTAVVRDGLDEVGDSSGGRGSSGGTKGDSKAEGRPRSSGGGEKGEDEGEKGEKGEMEEDKSEKQDVQEKLKAAIAEQASQVGGGGRVGRNGAVGAAQAAAPIGAGMLWVLVSAAVAALAEAAGLPAPPQQMLPHSSGACPHHRAHTLPLRPMPFPSPPAPPPASPHSRPLAMRLRVPHNNAM